MTVRAADGQTVEVPFTLEVLPSQFVVTSGVPSFAAINGAPIMPQTLSFDLNNGVVSPWMVASTLSGTTPASVSLQPDPGASALAGGTYTADSVLSSPGIADKTVTASLSLTKATLSAPSTSLTLGGSKGRNLDVPQSMAVSLNTGTRSWPWTLSALPAWLSTTTPSGSANQSGTAVNVAPDLAGVAAGSTSATVTLSATVNGDVGSRLFALDTTNGAIAVVDLASRTKVASWTLGSAVSAQTSLLVIRPNGVDVVLVGNGHAYSEGRDLGLSGVISGLLTASSDGRRVYVQETGGAPSMFYAYDVDYSAISGGVPMVSCQATGVSSGAYGRDIAVSGDGTRLYVGMAPPFRCALVDPVTLRTIGGLPGVDSIYLNNIEVASDGRTICGGVSSLNSTNSIEVHAVDGTLQKTFTLRESSFPTS